MVRVNCLDASGRDETVLKWLTENIIGSLEIADFTNTEHLLGVQLQGLYYSEYQRRSKGVDAHMSEYDKNAFKDKFSNYLDRVVEEDREGYLNRILN